MRSFIGVLGVTLASVAVLCVVASHGWRTRTDALVAAMLRAPHRAGPDRFAAAELAGLPAPVAHYLRKVLPDGQPMLRHARLVQRGTFLVSPPDGWRPFAAVHTATVAPAGFVWDARIRTAPGLDVCVRDAYVNGAGRMQASLAGVLSLTDVHGRSVPTPWQGRWLRYERRAGLLVPVAGEVEWLLPAGAQPYWRGELQAVAFGSD